MGSHKNFICYFRGIAIHFPYLFLILEEKAMAILNTRELRVRGAAAADRFRPEGRSVVLLYCCVLAALSLGSNGLHLYLDSRIADTGGLSGLGLRSILQTIQSVLNYVNMFFGPFWSAGFLLAMLGMVRGSAPRTKELTGGFRRFGRILGGLAFELLVVIALVIAAVNLGSILFALTPMGQEMAAMLEPLMADPNFLTAEGVINLELLPVEELYRLVLPMAGITLVILLPVLIWLGYGFRMVTYLLMERPISGVRAHFESLRLMRGHKWQMLKLDLSFWWYHLLGVLIAVVGYLDVILGLAGVEVPINEMVLFFGTLAAYFVLLTGLYLWKKCDVDAAYVLAYEQIAYPEPAEATE